MNTFLSEIIIYFNVFENSLIIKNNKSYISSLINWINPQKGFKSQLLFRKSKDGNSIDKFHKLCDNQGPTLVLIK